MDSPVTIHSNLINGLRTVSACVPKKASAVTAQGGRFAAFPTTLAES